jgi:PAS domain S-box-containing protein
MSGFSIILFAGIFLATAMAVIIYAKNRRSEANILFAFLSLLIALCFNVDYRISLAQSETEVNALLRMVSFRNFVFPLSVHFFLVYTNQRYFLKKFWTYIILYVFPLLLITISNPLEILDVIYVDGSGWTFHPHKNLKGFLIALWIFSLVTLVQIMAVRHLIKTKSYPQRTHAWMLLVGFFISLVVPVVSDITLPLLGVFGAEGASVSFIAGMLIVGFAIFQYDLFAATPESAADEVIDSVTDAVLLTQRFGTITFCNPAAEQLTGFTRDELLKKSVNDLFHIGILDEKNFPGNTNITKELIRANGEVAHVMVSHTVLQNLPAQVRGHAFIFYEITELKKLLDQLSESEARYRNIFNNIQSIYFEMRPDGTITEVSPSVSTLTSYSREKVIGANIAVFFPEQKTLEQLWALKESDTCASGFEGELLDMDGSRQYCMISAMCIFEDGNPQRIVGSVTNIDELKKAEFRVLDSEKRYRLVTENASDFVAQLNEQGNFVYLSPSFRAFGHNPDVFIGRDGNDLVYPADLPVLQQKIRDSRASGVLGLFEFRLLQADGSYVWVETQGNWVEDGGERFLICNTRNISLRKVLEEQQRESEEKFRLLFERSPDGILLVKDLFTTVSANEALIRIFGYDSSEDFLNVPVMSHILPEYQIKMMEREMLRKSGIPTSNSFDIQICRKDGQICHVEYLEHEMVLQGQPHRQFIMRDITEKIIAEQKLVESEQRYSLLVENSPDDIFLFDKDCKFLMVNAQAAQNQGMKPGELVGKTMQEIFPHHIAERQAASVQKVFDTGRMSEHIKTVTRTALGDRWYTTILVPVKNAREKVVSVIGIGRDITEIEKAEIRIRKNEEMYRLFLENFQGIVFKMGIDNTFEFLYGEVSEITGHTIDEFMQGISRITPLLHPEDHYQMIRTISMLRRIPNSKTSAECRIIHRDGTVRFLRVFLQNLVDSQGAPAFIQGAVFDKTDLYELQNKVLSCIIETEERERSRFAEDLHDDLGPLLSTVRMYVNLIETKTPEQQKERQELIAFVKNLIDDAVQQTRNISYNIMPEILGQYGLVPSVKSFCSKIDKAHKVKVTIRAENFPDDTRFDAKTEVAFYRVIKELINNTLKHSGAEDIILRFIAHEGKYTIEYMDNGDGFDYNEKFKSGETLGLRNILHRVESIGGNAHFWTAPGQGLRVTMNW